MTIATLPDVSLKIYEINFDPIPLNTEMRIALFEFFKKSVFLAQQAEADFLANINNLDYSKPILNAIREFNHARSLIEDFVTSNLAEQSIGGKNDEAN